MDPMTRASADDLLRAYATHDRITRYLVENLPAEAWSARPPTGRSVAAIVAHMHNVRVMWLKAARVALVPDQLDRHTVTPDEALAALAESRDAIVHLLRTALTTTGKVRSAPPDALHFLAYLIAHEAHHRGQICMLARQLGHKLPQAVEFGMWEYGKRAREA